MSGAPVSKLSQACEPCRKRKIKCNGLAPCPPCAHHGLHCVFIERPRTGRSRKATQRGQRLSAFKYGEPPNDQLRSLLPKENVSAALGPFNDEAITSIFTTFHGLVTAYKGSVFPTHPIITPEELHECMKTRNKDGLAAAVVYSSAAATWSCVSALQIADDSQVARSLNRLVTSAIQAFNSTAPFELTSVHRIMVCVFVANCMVALNDSTTAFLYLRHAISMVETYRIDTEDTSTQPDWRKKHRLYWLLYIHERYQCISEYRSVMLPPLPHLPAEDAELPAGVHAGFLRVVELFKLVDGHFVTYWLSKGGCAPTNAQWITSKCDEFHAIDYDPEDDDSGNSQLTLSQRADLIITRHWLMSLLWRIAISHNVLPEISTDALSSLLPAEVSRRLRKGIEMIPERNITVHGVGIMQKLFELTDTMADVVLHSPDADLTKWVEQLDDLQYLGEKVMVSAHLDQVRKGILEDKFRRLQASSFRQQIIHSTSRPRPSSTQTLSSSHLKSIPWTSVRALSFDIFGTLIDWQDGLIDAALGTKAGPYLLQGRKELYIQLRKHDQIVEKECPTLKKPEINAEALRRYVSSLSVTELSQSDVDQAATEYGEAMGNFPAFEDTIDAITRLSKHYKLFPLSNIDHASFSRTLSGPLRSINFTASYIAEDIGSYKPSERNFRYLLDHIRKDHGVEKDELCHVAQSLYHDHATTKTLGIRSVWVDRYAVVREGDRDEESLREEYGFAARVEALREIADAVDEAFGRARE